MLIVVVAMISVDGPFFHGHVGARETADDFETGRTDSAPEMLRLLNVLLVEEEKLARAVDRFSEANNRREELIHLDEPHSVARLVVDLEHFDGGVDVVTDCFADKYEPEVTE